MQWGDEGKGKIVDFLARDFDYVVRFNGGDNAGHAVKVGGRRVGLRIVPAGVLHPHVTNVIAAGTVVNPQTLLDEAEDIPLDRLAISDRAHVVLPRHLEADRGRGTMGRGIGPAYADKALRFHAVRVGDLLRPGHKLAVLRKFARRFRECVCDTTALLNDALDRGKRVLLEGAQGALLDVDHGTYPYVTASSTVAGGACAGAGIPPRRLGRVIGVVKSYMTRVGPGPFPTEAPAREADALRKTGLEFGEWAGRLRRCGWLDLVALKHAVMLNAPDELALTKLDVARAMKRVRVCVEYRGARPVYDEVGADDLPTFVAKRAKVPVTILSFGADRRDTMQRGS